MFKRFITAITIFAVLFFAWYFQAIQPVTRMSAPEVNFEIKSGSSVDRIANDLNAARLIRSRVAFKLTVIRLGLASRIQAGFFKLTPAMGATKIAEALTRAYARQTRVTIPEGLRSEEINLILEKTFSSVKGNRYNPSEFAAQTKNLEGRLFPDTYDFAPEASASDVVKKLTARFEGVVSDLKISDSELTKTLIIASLLEREAASSDEMPSVAGVISNRLEIGMALQIDATVQYALGRVRCKQIDCDWWKKDLTREDLRFKSPYNTYLNPGLPPTPISNPGKDALKAAASPRDTSALYYIHDLKGQIHYADTLTEHNRNVCTYLKKDCP